MMQDIYEKLKLTLILKSKSLKAFIQRLKTIQAFQLSPLFRIVLGIGKTAVRSPKQNEQTSKKSKIKKFLKKQKSKKIYEL